ncbi:MAG TPA: hypothetical protein VMW75_27380 [Thermoanaerobaculia bacterium]|nr:hypothetical protein [Thermoanaerobaculia bacterium]
MPRPSRRLALTALSLALVLILAAPPAQAGQSPSLGWLDTLAQQLAQWTASWWARPTPGRSAGQAQHPAKSPPSKLRIDCGGLIDPDGKCLSPIGIGINCGGEIDPNGKCLSPAPPH